MDPGTDATNPTLFARLRHRPNDQASWQAFVQRYGPKVYRWCSSWGLQQADAEDVTQTVLVEVVRQMQRFEYDASGSFRAWLKTITQRVWIKWVEARRRPGASSNDASTAAALLNAPSDEDLAQQLEEECEREMLEHAMDRVRLQVPEHVWEAFRLTALENWSGEAVAEKLGIKLGYVYVARSKVQKLLRVEVERLDRLPE